MTTTNSKVRNGEGGGDDQSRQQQMNRFTSLSTLGAQAPLSPTEMNESTTSDWIRRPFEYLVEFATSIGPEGGESNEEDIEGLPNERTPLMQNINQSNQTRSRTSLRRSSKYIGGGCVCDPLGRSSTSGSNQVVNGELQNQCRTCENVNRITRSQPCFAYGSVPSSSNILLDNPTANQSGPSTLTLAALAQICFASMSLLAATLANRQFTLSNENEPIDALQMLTWQGIFSSIVCLSILLISPSGRRSLVRKQSNASHLWIWSRSLIGCLTGILFIISAQRFSLADMVSVLYLAPIIYSCTSHLFFTPRHPFRAQLVSLSLWLGLVLMVQPGFLFGYLKNDGTPFEDETIAAMPLDLPGLINTKVIEGISFSLASASMTGCGLMILFTMTLFDQQICQKEIVKKSTVYQSVLCSSILTVPTSMIIRYIITKNWNLLNEGNVNFLLDIKSILLFFSIIIFQILAKLFQDLSMISGKNKTGSNSCRLGLISFLQPLLSNGINGIFSDLVGDVLSLFGCLLISVNLAWIASPEEEEDEEEEREGARQIGQNV